jgi:hypothetical protein
MDRDGLEWLHQDEVGKVQPEQCLEVLHHQVVNCRVYMISGEFPGGGGGGCVGGDSESIDV